MQTVRESKSFSDFTQRSLAAGKLLPVVADDNDTDECAAAHRHEDEEGQPVGAVFCRNKQRCGQHCRSTFT